MSDIFGNYSVSQLPWQQPSNAQIQSGWMPEVAQNQNVVNNLFSSGGGFGQQTNYYSGLGANQLSGAVYSQGGSNGTYNLAPAGTFSDYNAGGAWPSRGGGGGASPYQTTPNVWDTGASPFWGGGGSSGFGGSIYTPNVFDTGARAFQNFGGAGAIDWGNLFSQGQQQSPFSTGNFGAGMFGGLAGGGGGAYQGPNSQMDFSNLFSGGGAPQQPLPLQQQQPTDYGSLFGRGVGGTAGAPSVSETVPAPMPGAADQGAGMFSGLGGAGAVPGSSAVDWSKLFGGGEPAPATLGDRGLPTAAQPPADFGSRFGDWGGAASKPETASGGFGSGGNDSQLFGAKPSGSLSRESAFSYNPDSVWWQKEQTGDKGPSADDFAAQARARLAGLIGSPETAKAVEEAPAGEAGRAGMVGRAASEPAAGAAPVYDEKRRLDELDAYQRGLDAFIRKGGNPADYPDLKSEFPARPTARDIAQPGASAESPVTRLYPGADAPRPSADIFPARRLAPNGQAPEAFVVHYTTGRPDPANVAADWARTRPHTGTQYIMGRDGVIHDTLNEYGHAGTNHFSPKYINSQEGRGLTNQNTVGMEISAKNDADMTDAQIASLQRFAAANYAQTPFYGHGELVSNREPDEGIRGSQTILNARQAAGYPAPAPGATGTTPPPGFYDPITGVRGPDAASPQVAPRPPADVPSSELFPGGVPLPAARPNAEANLSQAHSILDTNVMDLVRKNSPSSASMVPSSIASQSLREAMGNTFTGGMIRSNITPENLAKGGITRADFDKAYAQGRPSQVPRFGGGDDFASPPGASQKLPAGLKQLPNGDIVAANYWQAPKEGTPEWNQQVYEPMAGSMVMRRPENQTIGGASSYDAFRRSENIDDRRGEQLGRDQLAALQARGSNYYADPEQAGAASNPLSAALGLKDLPAVQGGQAAGPIRPHGVADTPEEADAADLPLSPSRPTEQRSPGMQQNLDALGKEAGALQMPGEEGRRGNLNRPLEQPGRDQLAKQMTFGGFSPTPELRDNVFRTGVGPEMDAPTPEFMRTIAEAESSSNPNKQDPGSQYSGLFQLNKPEFTKYGGTGSIYDPDQNAFAAMGKMTKEGQMAQDALGRELTPVEQYMVHQQGLYGTLSHLTHPDQPAWKSWQQAASSSEEKAKTVIWGNLTPDMQKQFGNVNNITSRDYIDLWANKYLEKQIESGQPMTFPGGFSRASP